MKAIATHVKSNGPGSNVIVSERFMLLLRLSIQ